MRQILIAFILFGSSIAMGQDSTNRRVNPMWAMDHPPKGSNTIVISGVTFDQAAQRIMDAGYFIDFRDSVLKILRTEPKTDKYNHSCVFHIRVKDSVITVMGELTMKFMNEDMKTVIQRSGMKNSPYMVAWEMMENLAEKLNGQISYAKL